MSKHQQILPVAGPWSLETSKRFWESFTPTAIAGDEARGVLHTRFLSEYDWTPAEAVVTQDSNQARIEATGDGNLDAAIGQVARFLSLDVDASAWPEIGQRDPVIAAAQAALPGFRPCGFHSPYEAACWAVLSQRTRVPEAARLRRELIAAHGVGGAIPAPAVLSREIALGHVELPGRKAEYLAAVAEAAVEGALTGPHLRSLPEETAREQLLAITGIGPSPPTSFSFVAPTPPTSFPMPNDASIRKSPTSTGQTQPSRESLKPGAHSAPGRPFTCAPSAKDGCTK